MLYVTTRSDKEIFSAGDVLLQDRGPEGGWFVPKALPRLEREHISALKGKSFNQCLADILNLLLETELTAFDLDFSAGRSTARLSALPHRIWVGECWHNLELDFHRTVRNIWNSLELPKYHEPTDWFQIAVGIGVIFGFFGKLMRKDAASWKEPVDIAVPSGDFRWVMAAWYARSMGLPVANIVICCNDNSPAWELLHHGQLRTNLNVIPTDTPLCDHALPEVMERLIHGCGGVREAERFLMAREMSRMYIPSDMTLDALRKGMQASVVGQDRIGSAIPNVYRSHGELFGPYTALAYSGLLDYRAGGGESRHALILSHIGPGRDLPFVCAAMGMEEQELEQILNQ